jgi:quercetin dioxygenase-like cupin family protein
MSEQKPTHPALPQDDLSRLLTIAGSDRDKKATHVGLVGDTYTVLLSGEDTNGRFCLIDMYIPPNGGPGPHRHDFEETFTVLEGEIEATFRGTRAMVHTGETVNIPANAPHFFHNAGPMPARVLCICSPAGLEKFFLEVGTPVTGRTTLPPELSESQKEEFIRRASALAPKYRMELLREA